MSARVYACAQPGERKSLHGWKDNGYEVDIVVELQQKPIPMEVKYKENITTKDLRGLEEFEKKHNNPFSMVVTRNKLEMKEKRVFIPLWLFLLMC